MNFDWAVTEHRSQLKPWIGENFPGYFTDIQRAARKSLPRKPDRELKGLLGLALSTRSLQGSFTAPIEIHATSEIIQTSNRSPDYDNEAEKSFIEGIKSFFLCRNSRTDDCTKREKTVFAFLIYFVIITALLLIIVLVLTTTLSRIRQEDDEKSDQAANDILKPTSSPKSPTNRSSVSFPRSLTSLLSTKSLTSTDSIGKTSGVTSILTVRQTMQSTTSKPSLTIASTHEPTSIVSTSPITSVSQMIPSLSTPSLPRIVSQSLNCSSDICLSANKVFERIDFTQSPCEDFFEFSCGGWTKQKQNISFANSKNIPRSLQEELRQTLLLEIRGLYKELSPDILRYPYSEEDDSFTAKVSKRLYQACEESNRNGEPFTGLQEVHRLTDPLGMTQDGVISSSLSDLLRICFTQFQVTPFFQLTLTTIENENNVLVHGVRIEPLSMYLDANIYKQSVQMGQESYNYVEALTTILFTYLTSFGQSEIFTGQGADSPTKPVPRFDELFLMVKQTFYMKAKLLEILEETTASNISSLSTTTVGTYSSLKAIYPNIDWDSAIGDISDEILIEIVNPDYFHGLNDWWISSDVQDMKLYVFITLLSKRMWTYMPASLRGQLANIGAKGDLIYTDIDCVEHTLNLAGSEVHALYVGRNTQRVLNNRITLSILKNDIIEHFLKFVTSSSWIQPDVERVVSAYARNVKVNFSPLQTSVRQTSEITGGNQTFLSLAIELHKQKFESSMSALGTEVTEIPLEWTDTRPVYNAYFNSIGFPTALAVYLHEDIAHFELYGHMGMLIAQEVMKLLTGIPTAGFPPQWWGADTLKAFDDDVTRCFIKQLSTSPNGIYDLENVIKSNGAFQLVRQVYLTKDPDAENVIPDTNFTRNMMFLTNIAQLQCVMYDDTIETTAAAERFSEAILCNLFNDADIRCCCDFSLQQQVAKWQEKGRRKEFVGCIFSTMAHLHLILYN